MNLATQPASVQDHIGTTFPANGALTFWSLANTPFHLIEPIFNNSSYQEHCPKKRSPTSALKMANKELATFVAHEKGMPTTIIAGSHGRAHAGSGYEIFTVEPPASPQAPSNVKPFATISKKEYAPDHWSTTIDFHVSIDIYERQTYSDKLLSSFQFYSEEVDHNDIASSLVQILNTQCRAVLMRPRGGFYWVPDTHTSTWKQFTNNLSSIGVANNHIYSIGVAHDDDLIKAVTNGIQNEVKSKVSKLIELSQSNDLGERALKSKEQAAIQLKQRINQIESDLGLQNAFDGLRQGCDLAKQVAAEAVLSKMAEI